MTPWPWWVGLLIGAGIIAAITVIEEVVGEIRHRRERAELRAFCRKKIDQLETEALVQAEVRRFRTMVYPNRRRDLPS